MAIREENLKELRATLGVTGREREEDKEEGGDSGHVRPSEVGPSRRERLGCSDVFKRERLSLSKW